MKIERVSETLSGNPMIEIDVAPLDINGNPHVSDELAALLKPHLQETDNIAIRYVDEGLPTTATVVLSEMYVWVEASAKTVRWYDARVIAFGTKTGKVGVNAYFRPIRMEMVELRTAQFIADASVYNFQEVYPNTEAAARDTERLLGMADAAYEHERLKRQQQRPVVRPSETPAVQPAKPWWRRLLG